jgi:3-oxoadipate enol-lactonase
MNTEPVTLAHEIHGNGLPVILIHGFPFDRSIWQPIVPLLKEHARLILPDLRGFGTSPKTEEEAYTMTMHAEDIRFLMERIGIEKAILVGHSMGGYVALAFAHAFPSRLLGMALVASHADPDPPGRREGRLQTAAQIRERGIAPLLEEMPPRLTPNPAVQKTVYHLIARCSPQTAIRAQLGMAQRDDAFPWLVGIHAPVLILSGEQDPLLIPERLRAMMQVLPDAEWVSLPGVGHMPMLEAPQATAEAIKSLIARVQFSPH